MQGTYDPSELLYGLAQDLLGSLEDGTLLRLKSAHLSDGLYHVKSGDHTLYYTVMQLQI